MSALKISFKLKKNQLFLFFIILAQFEIANSQQVLLNDYPKQAIDQVMMVAYNDPACKKISPFYLEIGDEKTQRPYVSQSISRSGTQSYNQFSKMNLASASKWLFAAYAFQANSNLTNESLDALRMKGGYDDFKDIRCTGLVTVQGCFNLGGNQPVSVRPYKFAYGAGNFQSVAVKNLGLSNLRIADLKTRYKSVLGIDVDFSKPAFTGFNSSTPFEYAKFLKQILSKKLIISQKLGVDSVCADSRLCPESVTYSPVPLESMMLSFSGRKQYLFSQSWKYSYGHWIEPDGAFSSPGLFGFYPWINSKKDYYGIIAREQKIRFIEAFADSAICGQKIRAAWESNR